MQITEKIQLEDALAVVKDAEIAVLSIYNDPNTLEVMYKEDKSPLTQADVTSHRILTEGLSKIDSNVPVVSEEQPQDINERHMMSEYYWLIDPIDGTKEFISRAGQFSICVALMKQGVPILGIVSAPALRELYYGGKEYGSFKIDESGNAQKLPISSPQHIIYGSISNTNDATKEYIANHYADYDMQAVGSQLKFTYLAEGKAVAYPRVGTDMKVWDIAAGHAIVEGAGGKVERPDESAIDYTKPDFLAGDFVAKIS